MIFYYFIFPWAKAPRLHDMTPLGPFKFPRKRKNSFTIKFRHMNAVFYGKNDFSHPDFILHGKIFLTLFPFYVFMFLC